MSEGRRRARRTQGGLGPRGRTRRHLGDLVRDAVPDPVPDRAEGSLAHLRRPDRGRKWRRHAARQLHGRALGRPLRPPLGPAPRLVGGGRRAGLDPVASGCRDRRRTPGRGLPERHRRYLTGRLGRVGGPARRASYVGRDQPGRVERGLRDRSTRRGAAGHAQLRAPVRRGRCRGSPRPPGDVADAAPFRGPRGRSRGARARALAVAASQPFDPDAAAGDRAGRHRLPAALHDPAGVPARPRRAGRAVRRPDRGRVGADPVAGDPGRAATPPAARRTHPCYRLRTGGCRLRHLRVGSARAGGRCRRGARHGRAHRR